MGEVRGHQRDRTEIAAAAVLRRVAAPEEHEAPPRLWPPKDLWAWLKGYHELGTAERIVPLAFAAIYVAELIRQATVELRR